MTPWTHLYLNQGPIGGGGDCDNLHMVYQCDCDNLHTVLEHVFMEKKTFLLLIFGKIFENKSCLPPKTEQLLFRNLCFSFYRLPATQGQSSQIATFFELCPCMAGSP
jgi:hypothetical protein